MDTLSYLMQGICAAQVMQDDIYKYVKSDTLKGMNWLCGDENGSFGPLGCNGGALPPMQPQTSKRQWHHACPRPRAMSLKCLQRHPSQQGPPANIVDFGHRAAP